MTLRTALLLATMSCSAHAETTGQPVLPVGTGADFDVITFEQMDPITATVTYYNAESRTSRHAERYYQGDNGLACHVVIVVGGSDLPETITATCEGGWSVDTPEQEVADGDEVTVNIRLALF